jgi:hypothetical protein
MNASFPATEPGGPPSSRIAMSAGTARAIRGLQSGSDGREPAIALAGLGECAVYASERAGHCSGKASRSQHRRPRRGSAPAYCPQTGHRLERRATLDVAATALDAEIGEAAANAKLQRIAAKNVVLNGPQNIEAEEIALHDPALLLTSRRVEQLQPRPTHANRSRTTRAQKSASQSTAWASSGSAPSASAIKPSYLKLILRSLSTRSQPRHRYVDDRPANEF